MRPIRTLLIDNFDSFTANIFQMVARVNGVAPIVVRNDEATWEALLALGCDNVILSPGPGRPDEPARFGVCADIIAHATVPVLGVCLGHQGIALAFGGKVVPAPMPMHGRSDRVTHDGGTPLFAGIPRTFSAVRYHSLCVADLPADLVATAHADDGVVMALQHRTRPLYGVQFHPESIATEHGLRLFESFARIADPTFVPAPPPVVAPRAPRAPTDGLVLRWRRFASAPPTDAVFSSLFAPGVRPFWLDSSLVGTGARFSFMGDASGPLAQRWRHDVLAQRLEIVGPGAAVREGALLDHLQRELAARRVGDDALPFDFQCGYLGYLAYELKAECGARPGPRAPHPDAQLWFVDRMLAFDHADGSVYALCVDVPAREARALAWLDEVGNRLAAVRPPLPLPDHHAPIAWRHDPERYREQIARCRQALLSGESYELCLTNTLRSDGVPDALALYRRLRADNPAPYAAFLACDELTLACSSPERFLRVDRHGDVEARPIKGTAPRGANPAADDALREALACDAKNRAENLMIVDVLRNDLGRVCQVGSVEVPSLMEVERYATVHQLVSTVRGRLRDDADAIDLVRAAFPGGSMTGAPKLRSMELLDDIEGTARGPYAGALGYFSLNGACDLNIVIRTLVVDDGGCSLGVGGAVTVLSDAEAELAEMMLKAAAPQRAVARTPTATSGTR